jgi:hypothetical protein
MTANVSLHSFLNAIYVAPTFPAATEFDSDALVHVLAQVEDIFLLWPLSLSRCTSSTSTPAASASTISSSCAAASAPECASFGHDVRPGIKRGGVV